MTNRSNDRSARSDAVGPYCPGGCCTPLESLALADTVVRPDGSVSCVACWEADQDDAAAIDDPDYVDQDPQPSFSREGIAKKEIARLQTGTKVAKTGCKCGEAYGKRVQGAPKCSYCKEGN